MSKVWKSFIHIRTTVGSEVGRVLKSFRLLKRQEQYLVVTLVFMFISLSFFAFSAFAQTNSRSFVDYVVTPPTPPTTPPTTVTPTPTPEQNMINWRTPYVSLEADNFYITANGKKYFAQSSDLTIHSDPGSASYTSLEAIWHENDVEMRLFIYFNSDTTYWWSPELRTYDGNNPGNWKTYTGGRFFNSVLGNAYTAPTWDLYDDMSNPTVYNVHFDNIRIQAFTANLTTPTVTLTPTPTITPTPTSLPVSNGFYRVFVTSTTYNGNLGGLAGADVKCQERANEANLGGTWKAWLSSSTISVSARLNHSSEPYRLLNGQLIANNWSDLVDGLLINPININEYNSVLSDPPGRRWISTNTNIDGSLYHATTSCSNWTSDSVNEWSLIGYPSFTDDRWTNVTLQNCLNVRSLYCFEQTPYYPPTPTNTPTPTPTDIPTPTPTSGPDTIAPSITIVNPLDKSTIYALTNVEMQADVTDQGGSGVKKVEFYAGNKLMGGSKLLCTDTTAPYTCSWFVPNSYGTIFNIKIRAFDYAGNLSTKTSVVYITL